jgi:hypothetical protein
MGLARGMERRLEQLVDGLASALFRGRVHPVELGTRLEREADLAVYDTPTGPGAPNAFEVDLGGDTEPDDVIAAAERELADVLGEAAAERGWRLEGPVSVRIRCVGGPASHVSVTAAVSPGDVEPWAHLDGGAESIPIRFNRSIVGRSSEADVHLSQDDVSRQHALLWREAGSAWIVDLESSNGTFINGERCSDVVDLIDGDRISFADTETIFRVG